MDTLQIEAEGSSEHEGFDAYLAAVDEDDSDGSLLLQDDHGTTEPGAVRAQGGIANAGMQVESETDGENDNQVNTDILVDTDASSIGDVHDDDQQDQIGLIIEEEDAGSMLGDDHDDLGLIVEEERFNDSGSSDQQCEDESDSDFELMTDPGHACDGTETHGVPRPNGLAFSFTWAVRFIIALRSCFSDDELVKWFQVHQRLSTHFSGVGTVELAVSMLQAATQLVLRIPLAITFAFGCESARACREALQCRNHGACIYADVLARFPSHTQQELRSATDPQVAWEVLMQAQVLPGSHCVPHGACCLEGHVDADMSGSPCIPWSRMNHGKQPKGRRHPLTKLLQAWCRWLRHALPKFAVHENVKGFDCSYLEELVGDLYYIWHVPMSPSDAGFPFIRRPRWYSILVFRHGRPRPQCVNALYQRICVAMRYQATSDALTWVWRASQGELLEEENARRLSRQLPPVGAPSEDWTYLLSTKQVERLNQYYAQHGLDMHGREPHGREPATDLVFDLGQTASWSMTSTGVLPTLRRNTKRLWSPSRKRWLLRSECLAAMGFPVCPDLANEARVPCTDVSTLGPAYSTGNAMHVANAGCALMLGLVSAA